MRLHYGLPQSPPSPPTLGFIERWSRSGAAERANYALFLTELCDLLAVPRPNPTVPDDADNSYVFERAVQFHNGDGTTSTGRIDLYKRGCFVLEAKQGSSPAGSGLFGTATRTRRGTAVRETAGWDEAMLAARWQAEQYAKALPVAEGWPPFLVVVDVGYSIELYSDFSLTGKAYVAFPDALSYRVLLPELEHPHVRDRLRAVWMDPLSLDPSRHSARVTREVADQLAELARKLEESHPAERVAGFLMRCIFTSFAEDIHLLPPDSWVRLLESLRGDLSQFQPMVESLWDTMNRGGYSPIFRSHVLRFNGGLFEKVEALPVTAPQLELLIRAAKTQWQDVEPAIFGTLLERALDKDERHRLGAHYTPRAYVERLVVPTVVEPLREEWRDVQTAAIALDRAGRNAEAMDELRKFHRRLCGVRVLDPACGSGNFLYVTLEHLKRLEGEVVEASRGLGGGVTLEMAEVGLTVDPHQLLGLEVNPRAAAITDLVLWIGYLQWYFRTWGANAQPPEPVIKRFHNIECRDAVLAWDRVEPAVEPNGQVRTQWDGRTLRTHPVTGEQVPDETARRIVLRHENPRLPSWPEADYVVGNPPFIGNWRMRGELGDGYVEALRALYRDVPESTEYVMYWWHRAAGLVREGKARRFGFIATNSLRQTFNRRVVAHHLAAEKPLSLAYAVPDHPWVDSSDGAAVRISMTVGVAGKQEGLLCRVVREGEGDGEHTAVELQERRGMIHPDLTIGPNVAGAEALRANQNLSCPGVKLHGAGFIVTREEAQLLGLGRISGLERHIRPYRNGRDLAGASRGVMVIDLFGLSAEQVRQRFPEVYQWVQDRVKPERDQNNRPSYRQAWWIHGEPRSAFRPALAGLSRYIATVETAKHRVFQFLATSILPDNMLVAMATEDAYVLGVLSSRVHVAWALAAGGRLGVGNDPRYNKSRCFEPFPFPTATPSQQQRIRSLGEALDAHRKRQQQLHPDLTLTGMYNVLEKLRAGEEFIEQDRQVHDQGLLSVLGQLHDELDVAVLDAYGWAADLGTEEILFRLVDLNAVRTAEERKGLVRWLRPEFQRSGQASQTGLAVEGDAEEPTGSAKQRQPWPAELPARVRVLRTWVGEHRVPASVDDIRSRFRGARTNDVRDILETLVSLGQLRQVQERYVM